MTNALKRNVVIGLDYGTYSTKVVIRERNAQYGEVQRFDRSCEGYPTNAAPSAIREIDGRLYFGTEAMERRGGENYGSLKADLLASSGDNELDHRIDVLAASYLTWAMGEIIATDPRLANDRNFFQVSAPTSHKGAPWLESRYLRIIHAAYQFIQTYGSLQQGARYTDLSHTLSDTISLPVPDSSERRFTVGPETIAPMVSLQMNPLADTGIHLIIDMGATTTEMAVCGFNELSGGNYTLLGYSDSTINQGGSKLDEIDNLPVGSSQPPMEDFLSAMDKQAAKTWFRGFTIDSQNNRAARNWNSLKVLLTGGATYHREVRKHIDEKLKPRPVWIDGEHQKSVARHIPKTIKTFDGSDEDLSLFAVANGLSIQQAAWPQFVYGSEIEPLEGHCSGPEDLYPSYLDIF